MINYSFIIPHKNCPELLELLLKSIPIREDTEIIIVDDNSDNNSVDFSNFPGNKRQDTKLIFLKENYGAGYARNVGIKIAIGKWLLFADSDDYYTDCLNDLLDKYCCDSDTDIVFLNAKGIDSKGNILPLRMNVYIKNYIKKRFYSEKVLRYGFWTPWSRMVKSNIVKANNIEYETIPAGNDMMFCLNCSKYCHNISVEKNVVYYYRCPEDRSVTFKYKQSLFSVKSRVELSFRQSKLYNDVNYIFYPYHIRSYYFPDVKKEEIPEYRRIYKEVLKRNHYSMFKDLLYYLLFCIGRILKIV